MHSYMLSEFDKVIPMNYFRSTRTLDRGSSFFVSCSISNNLLLLNNWTIQTSL